MEALGGGIIRKRSDAGIRELTRGRIVTHEHIRRGESALHAALPEQERRLDLTIVGKP